MKISIVLAEGEKQIMMTPETEHERQALKMIAPEDTLQAVSKWGTFDDKPRHADFNISKCQGGYYRRFAEKDSLMFIISKKEDKTD